MQYDDQLDNTAIPVILLILDKRFGYKSPEKRALVDVLRKLFIDLNKHAEKVSRPRQILLDDKDPQSLCVRALVGSRIQQGSSELTQSPPKLPLSLVDWHSESAKFDEGPYVCTILGLDWIVGTVLGAKPIRDFTDYKAVEKQLKALSLSLGLDLYTENSPTYKRLRERERMKQQPFAYQGSVGHDEEPEGELGDIVTAFEQVWTPALAHILTELAPYKSLIAQRNSNKTLSVDFVNWVYLKQRKEDAHASSQAGKEYDALVSALANRKTNAVAEQDLESWLDDIVGTKGNSLAFKVVFQRALIHAFLEFMKIDDDALEAIDEDRNEDDEDFLSDDDDEEEADEGQQDSSTTSSESRIALLSRSRLDRAKEFVKALNAFAKAAPEVFDEKCTIQIEDEENLFWLGSILDAQRTIDFTLGASKRGKELVFIIAAIYACKSRKDELTKKTFMHFWDGIEDSDNTLHRRLNRSIDRYCADKGSGGRVLKAAGKSHSSASAEEECRKRLEWIWAQLGGSTVEAKTKKRKRR